MRDRWPFAPLAAAADDLAFRDDLTGLFNQRLLMHLFDQWWPELVAELPSLSLLMLDLDRFKEVNDTYGHLTGNLVLQKTADILRHTFRSHDILVRFGGDEFVVLLPGVSQTEAGALGERARQALTTCAFTAPAGDLMIDIPVPFSLGVASFPADGTSGREVLQCADVRLYTEKRRRRAPTVSTLAARWRRAAPWIGVATLSAVVMVGLAARLVGSRSTPTTTDRGPTPVAVRSEPEAPSSARERELLAEIARLKAELASRRMQLESQPQTAREKEAIALLQNQLQSLETSLGESQRASGTPAAPSPSPQPAATPVSAPPEAARGGGEVAAAVATPVSVTAPNEVRPQLIRFDRPAYPEMALRLRREATVELRVLVDATGRVMRVEPIGPAAGLGLDEAARRAALRAVFVPATRDGVAVMMETTLAVQFRLANYR